MRWAAIVVAAGRGVRFGQPKQLIELAGRPLVAWSIATFAEIESISDLVVVTEPEQCSDVAELARTFAPRLAVAVTPGGATRQRSVACGLAQVPAACDGVLVHDGARPLVRVADVRAAMALVGPGVGACLAAPVVDTIKLVGADGRVVRTLDRAQLWAAQTPQLALTADLRSAHERAARSEFEATDDATLLESAGSVVRIVAVSGENFKVTLPGDRERAEQILRDRRLAPAP
ncbi:MAG: 2-C-methyl-D-erythritol 4-phosphate cytidylyltransferase [Vulcanimicrobiaceae bacterium]